MFIEAIVTKILFENNTKKVEVSCPIFESYTAEVLSASNFTIPSPTVGDHGLLLFKDTSYTNATFIPFTNTSDSSLTDEGDTFSVKSNNGDTWEIAANSTNALLKGGDTQVKIADEKIAIGNNTAEVLDTIVQILSTFIDNASVIVNTGVGPGALNPAVLTTLNQLKTALSQIKGTL